jgi:hypothetical protein
MHESTHQQQPFSKKTNRIRRAFAGRKPIHELLEYVAASSLDIMERRGQSRKTDSLPVIIQGRDQSGNWFKQEVIAKNISRSGALLSGITRLVRTGDLLWLECAGKKYRFKVIWTRDSESHKLIQAAVHLFDTEPCPWVELCD